MHNDLKKNFKTEALQLWSNTCRNWTRVALCNSCNWRTQDEYGGHELAYASRAILGELLAELISNKALPPSAAGAVLDRAIASLQSLGNIVSVPGAIATVEDIRADLAKQPIR
jgi:hypothetical protein